MNPEKVAIKRILGLEGDVIKPRKPTPPPRPSPSNVLVTVPQGKVWVEGDEGFHSMDSNDYGPVNLFCSTPSGSVGPKSFSCVADVDGAGGTDTKGVDCRKSHSCRVAA